MEEPDKEERYIQQYLLGYLDEGERRVVEERLITDPDYLEKTIIIESELMEDYLDGMLDEDERERFIKYILPTERQVEKLRLAKALGTYTRVDAAANSPPVAKVSAQPFSLKRWISNLFSAKVWGLKLSAAAIILIIFFGVLATTIELLRNWSSDKNSRHSSLAQELTKLNTQESLDPEAIFHGFIIGPLKAGLFRDEEDIKKFAVPETESIVQLRLQIGAGEYQTFQAVLQTNENQEIFTLNNLKDKRINGERLVLIYIPTKILIPGNYQLRLSGLNQNNELEYLGRYTFQILRK